MGVSLVRLGRHYPTDVAGGVTLGTIVLLGPPVLASTVAARRRPIRQAFSPTQLPGF
jgi:membrane-associated phospholipid phosphatase